MPNGDDKNTGSTTDFSSDFSAATTAATPTQKVQTKPQAKTKSISKSTNGFSGDFDSALKKKDGIIDSSDGSAIPQPTSTPSQENDDLSFANSDFGKSVLSKPKELTPQELAIQNQNDFKDTQEQLTNSITEYNRLAGAKLSPTDVLSSAQKSSDFLQTLKDAVEKRRSDFERKLNDVTQTEYPDPKKFDENQNMVKELNDQSALVNKITDYTNLLTDYITKQTIQEDRKNGVTKDETINKIAKRINPKGYNQSASAAQPNNPDSGDFNPVEDISALWDKVVGTKDKDELLNTVKGYGELKYNDGLQSIATDKISQGILNNNQDLVNEGVAELKKVDNNVIYKYPSLLRQQMAQEVSRSVARESGQLEGDDTENYKEKIFGASKGDYERIMKEKGWFDDPKKKDQAQYLLDHTDLFSDASYVGGGLSNFISPFKNLFASTGDLIGFRNEKDIISDKIKDESFPKDTPNTKWNPIKTVVNTTANLVGMLAIAATTEGLGAEGGLSTKAAQNLGAWTSFGLPSYDENLKEAHDLTDNPFAQMAYASIGAALNAEGGKLLDIGKISRVPGLSDSFLKLSEKLSENAITEDAAKELLGKNQNKFVNFLVKYGKNVTKGAATMAYFNASNNILKAAFGDKEAAKNIIPQAGHAFMDGVLGMSIMGAFGAASDIRNEKNTTYKGFIYDMALSHDAAADAFKQGFDKGDYTQSEYDQKMAVLNTAMAAKNSVDAAEQERNITLTPEQKKVYVANKTAENFLRSKANTTENTELKSSYEKQANELNKQSKDIFEGLHFTSTLEPLYNLFDAEKNYNEELEKYKSGESKDDTQLLAAKEKYTDLQYRYFEEKKLPSNEKTETAESENTEGQNTQTEETKNNETEVPIDFTGKDNNYLANKEPDFFTDKERQTYNDLMNTDDGQKEAAQMVSDKKEEILSQSKTADNGSKSNSQQSSDQSQEIGKEGSQKSNGKEGDEENDVSDNANSLDKDTGADNVPVSSIKKEGGFTVNGIKSSDAKKIYGEVSKMDAPTDARSAALDYISNGGKLSEESINDVVGTAKRAALNTGKEFKSSEVKTRDYVDKDAPSIKDAAHKIWDDLPENLQNKINEQGIRNQLEDVVSSHNKRLSAANEYLDKYHFENNLTDLEKQHYEKTLPQEEDNLTKWLYSESENEYEDAAHVPDDEFINQIIDNYEQSNKEADTIPSTTPAKASDKPIGEADNIVENKGSTGTPTDGEPPVIPPTQISTEASEENMPVGMRNSIIDNSRIHRGLEPFVKEARRHWADNWNEVIKNIRENNLNTREFIQQAENSIRNNEKPIFNDYQNAIWYFDRLNTLNEMKITEDELKKATESQNEGSIAAVNDRLDYLQSLIEQSDYVAEKTGTEAGRGFASRQMMANLDYQLVSWSKNIDRLYNGNTPEFIKNFTDKIEAEYKQREQELKDHYEAEYKKAAEEAFAKQSKSKETTKKAQNKSLADKLRKAADSVEKFGKAQGIDGAESAGLSIDIQKKIADAMRHIADGIENNEGVGKLINVAVERFKGDSDEEEFKGYLSEALKNAGISTPQELRNNYIQDIKDISKETNSTSLNKDMVAPLKKLMSSYINDEGVKSLSELVTRVSNDIKDALPDVEERDIRDAFSGYGIKNDTAPKIQSELKKLSQQARTISDFQDLLKKPKNETAIQQIAREKKLAEKYKEVSQYMKELGIVADEPPTTEASKKQSAANYAKTRIKNLITQSAVSILEAKRNARNGLESLSPTELQILESERKKMSSQLSDINKIKNPETVIKKSLSLFDDKINEYKRLSKEYKDPLRNAGLSKEAKSDNFEKSEAYNKRRAELEQQKALLTTEMNPKVSEQEKAVLKYNEQLQKKIEGYKKRIQEGNYEKEEKSLPDISKNERSIYLEKRLKQLSNDYNKTKRIADLYNRKWYQKVFSLAAAAKRSFVLSRIGTLIRLGAAVVENSLFKPIETVSGGVTSLETTLLGARKLNQQGERYGINSLKEFGMNWVAETAAWKSIGKGGKAWQDFISEAKNGYSELSLLYGEASHQVIPKELRDHWMNIEHALGAAGRIHGAEKSLSKRMEFERAYVVRKEAMKRKGMDVNNPVTQSSIAAMAYQDANRSILMENNWLSDQYEKLIKNLQDKNPSIEKSFAALTLQELMPIVKIPTNIILNAGRATLGVPLTGGVIAMRSIAEMINGNSKFGISRLSAEQSDALLRNLRMGNIGMALMMAGYFNPSAFGAGHYYQKGLAQPDDLDEGDVKFFGLKIPRYLADNPYLVSMKIGATLHDVFNYYKDEKDESFIQSATHALVAAGAGAIKESPILGTPSEAISALETGNSNFWYNQVKSTVEPGFLQEAAKSQDAQDDWYDIYFGGKAVPRQTDNVLDALKSGIPFLRQTLPEK